MVTNAGGGYSRWRDFAITRWREDSTRDNWGSFLYLRDAASGQYWSAAHQPTLRAGGFLRGRCSPRGARNSGAATTTTRRTRRSSFRRKTTSSCAGVRITNHSRVRRTIEVTSYAEVVLAPPVADAIQPSFGNLFVQTSILPARHAILCTRRPRSIGEHVPWSFHLLAARGADVTGISYETDRMRFIGRGRTAAAPLALADSAALSGTEGSVLDPIVAIRCQVALEPGQSATLDFVSGAGGSREACLGLIEKYQDRHLADRVFDLAWTHSNVILRPDQRERRRRAAVSPPCKLRALRKRGAARRDRRADAESPRPVRAVGLLDFRRPADRAGEDRGCRRTSISRAR